MFLYRDVAWLGSCDDGCLALAELLGWKVRCLRFLNECLLFQEFR